MVMEYKEIYIFVRVNESEKSHPNVLGVINLLIIALGKRECLVF